jgi:DNA mismatch endonuclease (patch repair protein)
MTAQRTYSRDARSPVPKNERVSELMSRIRSTNTGPEKAMRAALGAAGIRGYRLHYAKAPGRPDIVFVGRKVAVFIHGCFWHGCPHCRPRRPKRNKRFWEEKLDRNAARDKRNVRALRNAGWHVVTVWECRLKKDPMPAVRRVERALASGLR